MTLRSKALRLALVSTLSWSALGFLGGAWAGDISVLRVQNSVVIQSTEQLRYQTDPLSNQLIILDATLPAGFQMPEGVQWSRQNGSVSIILERGTTFSLTPDGRSLVLTPPAGPPPPLSQGEQAPILYPLTAADPAATAAMLQNLFPGVRVVVDARQRTLIIVANPADRAPIVELLHRLDAPRPQVQFEAEILEINRDATESLGIQYDSIFTFRLTEGDGTSLTRLGTLGRSPLNLSVGINLLKTSGAARVLARPRITTVDGLEARINSTQTTPLVTSNAGGGTSVQSITTGITLRMQPRIGADGTIETTVTITVSVPTGTTSQGVPQFSTREATTTVRVANGEPIAIGGLLEDRTVTGVQKVPVLGDLPIVGRLFTTTRTDTRSSDLIIVVTPRLVMSANTVYNPPAVPAVPTASPPAGEGQPTMPLSTPPAPGQP